MAESLARFSWRPVSDQGELFPEEAAAPGPPLGMAMEASGDQARWAKVGAPMI